MTDYDQLPPDEQARLRAEWAEQMTARRLALRFDEPEDEDDGDTA